jgi:polyphosphate glucokinase
MKVLVIDIGGTNIKLLVSGRRTARKIPSGPTLTPSQMVKAVKEATSDWTYDHASIGFPGPVSNNHPVREPVNLGKGWVRFNYEKALGVPVRMMNDAAMQALGSYKGKNMLFLGLGTGLGTTLVRDGAVIPMELAHLPYRKGHSFEEYVGDAGYKRLGKLAWRNHVKNVVDMLMKATVADYAVLGGGNVRHLKDMPPRTRRGNNANAFRGGFRLWQENATWS